VGLEVTCVLLLVQVHNTREYDVVAEQQQLVQGAALHHTHTFSGVQHTRVAVHSCIMCAALHHTHKHSVVQTFSTRVACSSVRSCFMCANSSVNQGCVLMLASCECVRACACVQACVCAYTKSVSGTARKHTYSWYRCKLNVSAAQCACMCVLS